MKLISSMCWCSRTEVAIPVSWVGQSITDSCGPGCGPGCQMVKAPDEFEIDPWDHVPERPKNWKMAKFVPSKYHPAHDTAPGLPVRTDAVGLLIGQGLCACGCGETSDSETARFCMGHDVRLKGKLIRAESAGLPLVLYTELDGWIEMETIEPLSYADQFTTEKLDWRAHISTSVDRVISRISKTGTRRIA